MTPDMIRASAEATICGLYERAQCRRPRIVWCGSPIEALGKALLRKRAGGLIGPRFNEVLGEGLREDRAHALRVTAIFWGELLGGIGRELDPLLARHPALEDLSPRCCVPVSTSPVVWPEDSIRPRGGVNIGAAMRVTSMAIASAACWALPRERVCWVVDPPNIVKWDAEGHLHCETGTALALRGVHHRFHYWRGRRVARALIEQPEAISVAAIEAEPEMDMRRIMIERMGIERFISEADTERRHYDKTGILWRKTFGPYHDEAWQVVEVVNGTAEPGGARRRYFLQVPPRIETAREAVAWTYGLEEKDYRVSVRT